MTTGSEVQLTGRYLSTDFTICFSHRDALYPGGTAYLAPYLSPGDPDARGQTCRIDVASLLTGTGPGPGYLRDQGGSHVLSNQAQRLRQYVVNPGRPTFLAVQDIYCGARRLALQSCSGAALLHASALRLGARTILFVGPKGAGKSTCLFAGLLGAGATVVSSDKLVLHPSADGDLSCTGLIEGLRISRDNVAFFGDRFSEAPVVRFWKDISNWAPSRLQFGKLTVPPLEAVRLFGNPIALETRPAALLLLDPEPRKTGLVRQHDEVRVARDLKAHFLEDTSPLEHGLPRDDAAEAHIIRRLIARCEIFRLSGRPSLPDLVGIINEISRADPSAEFDARRKDRAG